MATKPVPWQGEGLPFPGAWEGPMEDWVPYRGMRSSGVHGGLKAPCKIDALCLPACAAGRVTQPGAALAVCNARAAFVGLPERLITGGTPSAAHSLALRAGGLSSPNWAGEEGAAGDCPPHRASCAPRLQSVGISNPLIPPGSWVQVGGSTSAPHSLAGWWGHGSGDNYLGKLCPAYVHMVSSSSSLVPGGLGRVGSFMGLFSLLAPFHTALFSFLLSRAPSFLLPRLSPGPAASFSRRVDLLPRMLPRALGAGTSAPVGTRATAAPGTLLGACGF